MNTGDALAKASTLSLGLSSFCRERALKASADIGEAMLFVVDGSWNRPVVHATL